MWHGLVKSCMAFMFFHRQAHFALERPGMTSRARHARTNQPAGQRTSTVKCQLTCLLPNLDSTRGHGAAACLDAFPNTQPAMALTHNQRLLLKQFAAPSLLILGSMLLSTSCEAIFRHSETRIRRFDGCAQPLEVTACKHKRPDQPAFLTEDWVYESPSRHTPGC